MAPWKRYDVYLRTTTDDGEDTVKTRVSAKTMKKLMAMMVVERAAQDKHRQRAKKAYDRKKKRKNMNYLANLFLSDVTLMRK